MAECIKTVKNIMKLTCY